MHLRPFSELKILIIKIQQNLKIGDPLEFMATPNTPLKQFAQIPKDTAADLWM
jgi:hypothetical protein